MALDSDSAQQPYTPPHAGTIDRPSEVRYGRKHSGLGIAAFLLSLITGIATFVLVCTAGVMELTTPGGIDEEAPLTFILGASLLVAIGFSLLGVGLGFAGLFQRDRLRLFSVLGIFFNLMIIAGFVVLMVIGTSIEAR